MINVTHDVPCYFQISIVSICEDLMGDKLMGDYFNMLHWDTWIQ